jgi:hypothetical protein
MAQTIVLSGTIALGSGRTLTLSKSYESDHLRIRDAEISAGDLLTLTFDNSVEGDDLKFLVIESRLAADSSQVAPVKYSVLDADGADPANGTAWREVNGTLVSWEDITLSATYKLYLYNSGANKIAVTVAVGLDG